MMRVWAAAWALACAAAAYPQGTGESFPSKPVRIILPFAGGTELIGRMIATKIGSALGQPVVVEPRVGAAGNIGWEAAARAPADGYTLVMGAVPLLTNPHLHAKVGYDPLKSFAPIALVASIPNMLIVHPAVPARTLKELLAVARASPGKLVYGSGGVGSANHLAAEFIQSAAKVRFTHVPYKSATFAVTGALSGDVDMVILVVASAMPFVNAGKMRAIVVMDSKRNPSAPGVPASAEAGMPELIAVNWYALLAPAGTARSALDRLNAEVVKAMGTQEARSAILSLGGEPAAYSPEQTAEFLRAEYARWGKVIREAKIKTE